jgi:tetratricopeptide (TPR) repeat protein
MANGVLIVSFTRPVDLPYDRFANIPDYTSAVRRDPDRKGLRVALTRKVTVNTIVAGERLFVDLLPEHWSGPPPSLPQEIVEDLSRRTREAEKRARQQQAAERTRPQPVQRVRVSLQPTFSRYVFELPDAVAVSHERADDKLTLKFESPVKFDLADAKAAQAPMIDRIEATSTDTAATVTLGLIGKVDVRTFREDSNLVVDIVTVESTRRRTAGGAGDLDALLDQKPQQQSAFAKEILTPKADEPRPQPGRAPVPGRKPAADGAGPDASKPEGAEAAAPSRGAPAKVTLKRQDETLRLTFPFAAQTPAAAFSRADTFWLVFDTGAPLDISGLTGHPQIREAVATSQGDTQILRLRFERPRLFGMAPDDNNWIVTVGDAISDPTVPLNVVRSVASELRPSVQISLDDPRQLHRVEDPDAGDTLIVVTGTGPARGLIRSQDFVEFRALASVHGVVIAPLAEDLAVELASDRVMIGRPGGLTLSQSGPGARRAGLLRPTVFDAQTWVADRQADFNARLLTLVNAAAASSDAKRTLARLDLARFYAARGMYEESKGVLDVAIAEERPSAEDTIGLVMRGVAKVMIGRADDALLDLNNPMVGNQNDAQLWRALANARLGKWAEARDGFRKSEMAVGTLPVDLQREILKQDLRAAIEVRDFGSATNQLNELESVGVEPSSMPVLYVLAGRIHEGLGHSAEALKAYRAAADSPDRAVAAQGRLREIVLRFQLGDLKPADVITELETLTAIWRGDETEGEALQLLARLYTQEGRYRSAFNVMRTALKTQSNSDLTRRMQDEAAATFDALFLGGRGDTMPAIEALSLFYDFRELTPIGRRGDEMIRRLTDRLVSMDLLTQAAELLQHQVDHRLQGAARSQVAARLAAIYLMNHRPERALAALRSTRGSELPMDLRNFRLLLEARSLSEIGRHGLAIEVVQNIDGPEAMRLRADILWAARRHREAAEQIELLYGERWRDWQPLSEVERRDVLKAGIGFAIGEDSIGLARFREKFGPLMSASPDRKAFEIVCSPQSSSGEAFREIARSIAAIDTLDQFLKDLRARYPETATLMAPGRPIPPGAALRPLRPDFAATGAVGGK